MCSRQRWGEVVAAVVVLIWFFLLFHFGWVR